MALLIKWLGRTLFVIWGVDGIACLYFKDRAISEMHNLACCKDAVSFSSLTDHPVLISHGTALGYHLTQWIFFGCSGLAAALHFADRRLAQRASSAENDR